MNVKTTNFVFSLFFLSGQIQKLGVSFQLLPLLWSIANVKFHIYESRRKCKQYKTPDYTKSKFPNRELNIITRMYHTF